MAAAIFPILLLGVGGAYVYTKQKEKSDKRKGVDCPPENTITINESVSAFQQAQAKYGDRQEPFLETETYIKTLLPQGCNKKSAQSSVKMSADFGTEKVDLNITVPDLYMLGLLGSIGNRVEAGKLTQEQGRAFWNQGLDWYNDLMGTPFDPNSLGMQKFMQAFAQALMAAMKKAIEQGGLVPEPAALCPDKVIINFTQEIRDEYVKSVNEFLESGERNPMTIAAYMFGRTMPSGCRRGDYKVIVDLLVNGEHFRTYDAASYFAALVVQVMEIMMKQGLMTQQTATQIMNDLRANYKSLTGKNLPENLI